MIIKQYETKKYPGIKFYVDENKKLFCIMGSVRLLHENGLIDEEEYEKSKTNGLSRYGIIFREDDEHVFYVENIEKGKYLISVVQGVLENERFSS
jgi:hypothetical protein